MEGICPRNWESLGGDKFNRVAKLPAGRRGKGEIYMAEITLRNLISPFFFFFVSRTRSERAFPPPPPPCVELSQYLVARRWFCFHLRCLW